MGERVSERASASRPSDSVRLKTNIGMHSPYWHGFDNLGDQKTTCSFRIYRNIGSNIERYVNSFQQSNKHECSICMLIDKCDDCVLK